METKSWKVPLAFLRFSQMTTISIVVILIWSLVSKTIPNISDIFYEFLEYHRNNTKNIDASVMGASPNIDILPAPIRLNNEEQRTLSQTIQVKCSDAWETKTNTIDDVHIHLEQSSVFEFLSIGDWGVISDESQSINPQLRELTRVMNDQSRNSQFVVSLGDHFYENNVAHALHPRWHYGFQQLFNGRWLRKLNFFAIAGNNDWQLFNKHSAKGVEVQMERTSYDNRWCMPHLYYTIRFVIHNTNDEKNGIFEPLLVRLVALDTTAILKRLKDYDYLSQQLRWFKGVLQRSQQNNGNIESVSIDANGAISGNSAHKLRSMNDDWVIVMGHHPFEKSIRACDSESEENIIRQRMQPYLDTMLEYDNIPLYLSGHHHIWRLSKLARDNTPNQRDLWLGVTGAAGREDTLFCSHYPPHMIGGGTQFSFGKIRLSKREMTFSIIDYQNRTLLSQTKQHT